MKSAGVKIILLFLLIGQFLVAQTPYEVVDPDYKPKKQLVQDFGQMLNSTERNQLEQTLVAYDDSTSVQILVVTFKKLDGYPITMLANEIGEKFGVGQKDKHNGIVILLSNDDRKVELRGGYGIQAKMPPTIEKLIIDREMIPEFKKGNYYQGLMNAVTAIQKQLAGQYQAEPKKNRKEGIIFFFVFFFIIILFIIIASKGGGKNGGNRTRRGFDLGDIILMNSGRRSWGSGSWGGSSGGGFGGGGFGGFGGGSFGGGGASGSW